ncbi:MAG: hypothetical protein M1586_00765 [Patescibacteria group bacterium]|nr:hypothetical protein [Patescibacteria group bacterium]MCL5261817.1 hypothetical protein [Patescibacteria group bacterium]
MVLLPHALVGAAIGAAVRNPVLGFCLGILSHHLMDAFPHVDYGSRVIAKSGPRFLGRRPDLKPDSPRRFDETFWKILFVDFTVAWSIFLWIFYRLPSDLWLSVFFGTFGSLLPDVLSFYPPLTRVFVKKYRIAAFIANIHNFFHWGLPIKGIFWGVFWQILFAGSALYYLIKIIR